MKDASYVDIVRYCEDSFDKYGDCHKGLAWPNLEDTKVRYQVMLDIIKEQEKVSILDFGCGLGHLYQYILDKQDQNKIDYCGLDLSDIFIGKCKEKYPTVDFICLDILKEGIEKVPQVDYAVFNGVFTVKRELTHEEMEKYLYEMLINIFPKVNKGIAFNVMSKVVDWERDDLFHMPLDPLSVFLTKNLTRHFVIRNDYGLYEYTVYVYKTAQR